MTFKEALSSTWPFYLEMSWMGDKAFIEDASENSFIEPTFYWSWSTQLSLSPRGKKSFRKWRAISPGRRAIEVLPPGEEQSLERWAQGRVGALCREGGSHKVIKDKEEKLSGKLDCGCSFKNKTAITLSDGPVENQPTQFHNTVIQRRTRNPRLPGENVTPYMSPPWWPEVISPFMVPPTPQWCVIVNNTSTVGGRVHGGLAPGFWNQTKSVGPATSQLWHGIFMKEEWAYCFSNTLKTLKQYILLQPKTNKQKSMYL